MTALKNLDLPRQVQNYEPPHKGRRCGGLLCYARPGFKLRAAQISSTCEAAMRWPSFCCHTAVDVRKILSVSCAEWGRALKSRAQSAKARTFRPKEEMAAATCLSASQESHRVREIARANMLGQQIGKRGLLSYQFNTE
jgi:hypothetical protein